MQDKSYFSQFFLFTYQLVALYSYKSKWEWEKKSIIFQFLKIIEKQVLDYVTIFWIFKEAWPCLHKSLMKYRCKQTEKENIFLENTPFVSSLLVPIFFFRKYSSCLHLLSYLILKIGRYFYLLLIFFYYLKKKLGLF